MPGREPQPWDQEAIMAIKVMLAAGAFKPAGELHEAVSKQVGRSPAEIQSLCRSLIGSYEIEMTDTLDYRVPRQRRKQLEKARSRV